MKFLTNSSSLSGVTLCLLVLSSGMLSAQVGPGWVNSTKPTIAEARAFAENSGTNASGVPSGFNRAYTENSATETEAAVSLAIRPTSLQAASASKAFTPSPLAAMSAAPTPTAGGNSADEITPDIENLARGLNYDPVKIYEYMRNFIDYDDYFGSKKGAQLTLLEGSGNSFDQASLLVSLLRASGYSPEYKYGPAIFTYTELTSWLGLDANPYSHFTDTEFLSYFGFSSSTPASEIPALRKKVASFYYFRDRGYFYLDTITSGNEEYLIIPHVWVSVNVGGVTHDYLSPGWKDYLDSDGIDLVTAMGYSRSDVLTQVGGTTTSPDAVSGLNYSNLASRLNTYSSNLTNHLKLYESSREANRITGSRRISQVTLGSLADSRKIFPSAFSSDWLPLETWTAIPDVHISKLQIQLGYNWNDTSKTFGTQVYNQTVKMTELKGQKLSLSFSGNSARIHLDEQLVGTAANVTGANVQMRLLATHNHYEVTRQSNGTYPVTGTAKSDQEEVKTYLKGDNFAYAIIYSFANPEKHLRKREQVLDGYRRAGLADTDWRVVTEILNVMGLNWMHQTYLQKQVIAPLMGVIPFNHHRFGRTSQETSFYIDVGLQFGAVQSRIFDVEQEKEFSYLTAFFSSAMEHGVIEQLQGESQSAVSTVKLLYLANQAGQKIYRTTGTNWNSVRSKLNNYSTATKDEIETAVTTNSGKALIPRNAEITLNQWEGVGYAIEEPTSISMKIDGGLFGGFNSDPSQVTLHDIYLYIESNPSYLLGANSGPSAPYTPYTTPQLASTDPVDMASGAFFINKDEIRIGNGSNPRGITFSRQYNSNSRYNKSGGLGYGWTHNYDMSATKRTSIKAGLGETISYHAVPFYVAAQVASDLYQNHANAKEWMTALLSVQWVSDQLKYNAVAVGMGNQTVEFIKMPDGSYEAPANVNMTLTSTGSGATEAFSVTQRHGSTYAFNPSGKIASITDLWGKAMTFTYTGDNLTEVADGYGRVLNINWSGDLISSVSDTNSRSVGFAYTDDNLTGCTDVEGKTWTYVYDAEHRMTFTKDPSNRTIIQNVYDSEGRVSEQYTFGDTAKHYKLSYTGYCNTEENPQSGRICYLYDSRTRAIGTIDPLGNETNAYYDGHDRKVLTVTPEYEISLYDYDSNNNLTLTTDPASEQVSMTYDSALRVKTVVDKRGNVTTINSYNAQHQPLQVTAPLGRVTNTAYKSTGEIDTVTDAEGNITANTYNNLGQLTKTTVNGETTQEFTYNSYGDIASSKDGLGQTTTFTYNKRRQIITVTAAPIAGQPASVITNTYDNEGMQLTTTDPRGNVTAFTYTATSKPETATQPAITVGGSQLNDIVTHSYDSRDWLTGSVNSLGHTSSVSYDAAHRSISSTDPLNRVTAKDYDENSRVTEVTDPLNRVSKMAYTSRSELDTITDPLNQDTANVYDPSGNLTRITNRRNKAYNYVFDAADRQSTLTTPTGKVTTSTYYLNDLPKTISEPSGDLTTLNYDNRLRLQSKVDPVATITYAYDLADNLKTATEGAATLTRNYDARNRLINYTSADGDLIQYEYDSSNNLTNITYPADTQHPTGKKVSYTYNARNQLETVTDWANRVTTYQYDRIGRNVGVVRHNGTICTMEYDAGSQLLTVRESANGKLFNFQKFAYDNGGQITRKLIVPKGQKAPWTEPTYSATHDDDNRLLTLNGSNIVHDADGNMTSGPITASSGNLTLGYNSRNQLKTADGTSYVYDAEGRRRSLTNSDGVIRYTTDPSGELSLLLVKHNPDGTKNYYVYGLGLLYEANQTGSDPETTISYHFDQVGSTIVRTDDAGEDIGRAEYSPYGELTWKSGNMETPLLYNGKFGVLTDSNGLLCMRARYYSPYLKRFLNADPIGFSGGANWFSYADGNPISLNDPLGLSATGSNIKPWNPLNGPQEFALYRDANGGFVDQWGNKHDSICMACHAPNLGAQMNMRGSLYGNLGWASAIGTVIGSVSPVGAEMLVVRGMATAGNLAVKSAAPIVDDTISLFHQGSLRGGQVSSTRGLSTSLSSELNQYRPGTQLYECRVPRKIYSQWLDDGLAFPKTDLHAPTGILTPEIRVMPPASGSLNPFLVRPPGS